MDRPARLPRALLAYSAALAVFLLVPPTLKSTVGPPTAFTAQELVDLFTPVVVLPLAWLVLDATGGIDRSMGLAFVAVAALWASGQGIHLAANAIGDAFQAGPPRDAFYASEAGDLDHFLDEDLGHWLWHAAWMSLSLVFLVRALTGGAGAWPGGALAAVAGLIHGATFAIVTTEGGTTPLGVPVSIGLLAVALAAIRRRPAHPIIQFLAVSSATSLGLYLVWASLHGWQLVEPCSVLGC
jgi:hypothetical protein